MTKTAPTRYNEQDARTRFDRVLNDALSAPRKPLQMTATMKRRALKKKLGKPSNKKSGTGGAIPAILFVLLRDQNDCSDI
jgi:hypothetical protein